MDIKTFLKTLHIDTPIEDNSNTMGIECYRIKWDWKKSNQFLGSNEEYVIVLNRNVHCMHRCNFIRVLETRVKPPLASILPLENNHLICHWPRVHSLACRWFLSHLIHFSTKFLTFSWCMRVFLLFDFDRFVSSIDQLRKEVRMIAFCMSRPISLIA